MAGPASTVLATILAVLGLLVGGQNMAPCCNQDIAPCCRSGERFETLPYFSENLYGNDTACDNRMCDCTLNGNRCPMTSLKGVWTRSEVAFYVILVTTGFILCGLILLLIVSYVFICFSCVNDAPDNILSIDTEFSQERAEIELRCIEPCQSV